VDNYTKAMRKLGREIEAESKMVMYAILSGLKSSISNYVTQKKTENLEQLTDAARLAELTNQDQMAEVKAEIRRLSSKWDRMTAAPIVDRSDNSCTHTRERSPSLSPRTLTPTRHVTFAESDRPRQSVQQEPRQNYTMNYPRYQQAQGAGRPYRGNPRGQRGNFGGSRFTSRGRGVMGNNFGSMDQPSFCVKCGKAPHANMLYCPANTKLCNSCHRRGHFSAVCRAAMRGRFGLSNTRRGTF